MNLKKELAGKEVIISLTSFTARIGTVHKTIKTLLAQTFKADHVILWLAVEEFPNREADLPSQLLELTMQGLEIDWCNNLRSFKKLVPTLRKYPDAIIVTADDDLYYLADWLERLVRSYIEDPNYIHVHRITKFYLDSNGEWAIVGGGKDHYPVPTFLHKLTGGSGALYPPHCLHPDVVDETKFMTLSPTNDDIWFWLMGVLGGCSVRVVPDKLIYLHHVEGTQDGPRLADINDAGDKLFWVDFNRIRKAYPELNDILHNEFIKMYSIEITALKEAHQDEINAIYRTWSWKIGRGITWFPRRLRDTIKVVRKYGIKETVYRIKDTVKEFQNRIKKLCWKGQVYNG